MPVTGTLPQIVIDNSFAVVAESCNDLILLYESIYESLPCYKKGHQLTNELREDMIWTWKKIKWYKSDFRSHLIIKDYIEKPNF